jgi:fumarate reductase flavoprotein subunit
MTTADVEVVDAGAGPTGFTLAIDLGRRGVRTLHITPPYDAFPARNSLTTTNCGLKVNERLQVIDVYGRQIAGLFAAGEVVGGFHGAGYLSGTGPGKAAVFGHAAGRAAAPATA